MTNQDYEKIIWITPSLEKAFFKEFYKNLGSDAIFANYAKKWKKSKENEAVVRVLWARISKFDPLNDFTTSFITF